MIQANLSSLLSVLCTTLWVTLCASQHTDKHVTLTPANPVLDGARVIVNINEVTRYQDLEWFANVFSQDGWQFILALDSSFGFDPLVPSSLSITINIPWTSTSDLLLGFTTDNANYITTSIPLDNSGRPNTIYPACVPSAFSTQSFASGDIASIPYMNRKCDISGGDCANWRSILPPSSLIHTLSSLTFTLDYNPATSILELYHTTLSSSRQIGQRCTFNSGFTTQTGLKLYISGGTLSDSFIISSLDIHSTIRHPTSNPTPSPSLNPTYPTSEPTVHPSNSPSESPTTGKPTFQPSLVTNPPSQSPTTAQPTQNPTTRIPTRQPSTQTLSPTKTPSMATFSPSTAPSSHPTALTVSPSLPPPTWNPTRSPSNDPTASPTDRNVPPGFLWGAFNQLCIDAAAYTGHCRDNTDIYFDTSVTCDSAYDCCLCESIECGLRSTPCLGLSARGNHALYGVQNIAIAGTAFAGTSIDCQGVSSCESTAFLGYNVVSVDCDGESSCKDSSIVLINPNPTLVIECGGISSCENANIEVRFDRTVRGMDCGVPGSGGGFVLEKVVCGSERACENMRLSVSRGDCMEVTVGMVECNVANGCDAAVFAFEQGVKVESCVCGSSCSNAVGLSQCYDGLMLLNCGGGSQSCAGQVSEITNPVNGFEMVCSDWGSCEAAVFSFVMERFAVPPVVSFGKFVFGGEYAAREAVFIFDNMQGGYVRIALVECAGLGSCMDTRFVLGDRVDIDQILCAPNACQGCVIQKTITAPELPCSAAGIAAVRMQ